MAGYPPARPGGRDAQESGHRSASYPGGGYASRGAAGYDERQRRGDDRQDWSEDTRSWGGGGGSWDDGAGSWSGQAVRWGGEDPRSWDSGVWSWADEDEAYPAADRPREASGGAEGNERLTALTGLVLLILFAAEGFTILSIHRLLTLHFFLGMLLIGPVVLKICSVLYRFARYYTGAEEYRRKGPPTPLLRVLGPLVLLTSLGVIGTGVMLAITGPSGLGTWLFLHRATFVLWFGVMTVHVLAYVWRLPKLVGSDLASRAGRRAYEALGGRAARWLLLAASVLAGLLLALLTVHSAGAWIGFFNGQGH